MSLKLGTTDISGVPTALINTVNNKLDASTYTSNPRTNAVYITETYHNGSSWYRVWSNGWCEQGGVLHTGAVTSYTISLLKTMADTDYFPTVSNMWNGDDTGGVSDYCLISGSGNLGRTTTTLRISTINNNNYYVNWRVDGYCA